MIIDGARRAVIGTAVVAVVAAGTWLVAPPMGVDLAAQVAHGDFYAHHGPAVLDFGWYGGLSPYAYSLLTPPAMAWLGGGIGGAKWLGAILAVVGAVLLVLLLLRTGARRPLTAGVIGALCLVGNLVSGRVTFTAGLAFAVATLLATTVRRASLGFTLAFVGGALTGAASPVAALFLALAATAMLLVGPDRQRRLAGLFAAIGAGLSILGMSVFFGVNGPMNTIASDTLRSVTVSLLIAAVVRPPVLRLGALFSALGVLAAAVLTTPVGLNAGRLSATFALPVLAGFATVPHLGRWSATTQAKLTEYRQRYGARRLSAFALTALLTVVALWQHPVAVRELSAAGDPTSSAQQFSPLLAQLAREQPGRIEVVSTVAFWEAAYVADSYPLARGWLRQADIARNPIFFTGHLTPAGYHDWLLDNGVRLVAIADGPVSSVSRDEARVVRAAPAYLNRVWRGSGWTLYSVVGSAGLAQGATVVAAAGDGVQLDVPVAQDVLVRVRWSRWLRTSGPGACLRQSPTGWTVLRVRQPGHYPIGGSLHPGPFC